MHESQRSIVIVAKLTETYCLGDHAYLPKLERDGLEVDVKALKNLLKRVGLLVIILGLGLGCLETFDRVLLLHYVHGKCYWPIEYDVMSSTEVDCMNTPPRTHFHLPR